MLNRKRLALFTTLFLITHLFLVSANQYSQPQRSRNRVLQPNVYAPHLYAQTLEMRLSLVNLPGAADRQSSWECSYELYFVSEAEYQKVFPQLVREGAEPDPTRFASKILLQRGTFKRARLSTLSDRTLVRKGISFQARIPDRDRTKFARLMTSYSVKVFDAQLKRSFYSTRVFFTYPFDDEPNRPESAFPRRVIYTNFFVSREGYLFESQWVRDGKSIEW